MFWFPPSPYRKRTRLAGPFAMCVVIRAWVSGITGAEPRPRRSWKPEHPCRLQGPAHVRKGPMMAAMMAGMAALIMAIEGQ